MTYTSTTSGMVQVTLNAAAVTAWVSNARAGFSICGRRISNRHTTHPNRKQGATNVIAAAVASGQERSCRRYTGMKTAVHIAAAHGSIQVRESKRRRGRVIIEQRLGTNPPTEKSIHRRQ